MDQFMQAAYQEAKKGRDEGGIPIGSVLVLDGNIIGRGHNQRVQQDSAILHAELAALEDAGRLTPDEYQRAILYSTLSSCDMCSGAILLFKIPKVVIGENRTFSGPEALLRSRGVTVDVLDDADCINLLQDFIREKPGLWGEDIGLHEDELTCCS